jgi:xanthine/uracil permease
MGFLIEKSFIEDTFYNDSLFKVRGKKKMNPTTIIYWLRMAMGIMAGAICAYLSNFLEGYGMTGMSVLLYSIVFALVIYMISLRLFKMKFQNQVETPSKITTTGIGIYFFAWLAFYILCYTIIYVNTGAVLELTPSV